MTVVDNLFEPLPTCETCEIKSLPNYNQVQAQQGVLVILGQPDDSFDRYMNNGWDGLVELMDDTVMIDHEAEAALSCARAHKCGECAVNFAAQERNNR